MEELAEISEKILELYRNIFGGTIIMNKLASINVGDIKDSEFSVLKNIIDNYQTNIDLYYNNMSMNWYLLSPCHTEKDLKEIYNNFKSLVEQIIVF